MKANARILVVDDEASVRHVCAEILRRAGFDPLEARDGSQALQMYQERCDEIELVISDVTMPVMDGLQMARRMFEIDSHPNIILMSGGIMPGLVPGEEEMVCAMLPKPFTSGQLVQTVQKCLNKP